MAELDWSRWPDFSRAELACKQTGECAMLPGFMDRLQQLRTALAVPLMINSGYRDRTHPKEAEKIAAGKEPGTHAMGRAVDIACDGRLFYRINALAAGLGFTGIGVGGRLVPAAGTWLRVISFIHLDDWDGGPRPNVWLY